MDKRTLIIVTAAAGFIVLVGALLFVRPMRRDVRPAAPSAATRIVSLSPTLTETVYDLGAGHQIVGVTSYCNYPPDAKTKEKLGDFINPNLEKIVSLEPSIILAERWSSSRIVEKLRGMGLNVVETVSPSSIAEIQLLISQVGGAIGRSAEADRLVTAMGHRIARIRARASALPYHPDIYLEIDPPSWTVGRRSFTSEAISIAGGRNVFNDVFTPSLLASQEEIVRRNPDIVVCFWQKKEQVAARPGWSDVKAVRRGMIVDNFNRDLLSRGSLRLIEGIEQLHKIILDSRPRQHETIRSDEQDGAFNPDRRRL